LHATRLGHIYQTQRNSVGAADAVRRGQDVRDRLRTRPDGDHRIPWLPDQGHLARG